MTFPFRLLIVFTLLLLAACRQSAQSTPTPAAAPDDIAITLEVEPAPPAVGNTELLVSVRTASGDAIDNASVIARGDMTHAGMTPEFGEADGGSDSIYRIPFRWTMGGDWIITVEVTLVGGETVSRTFDLSVES